MIKTLLFDLDGTLLDLDENEFVRAYTQRLAMHMEPRFAPERFGRALMSGVHAMTQNLDAARSLKTVFGERFYAELGTSEAEQDAELRRFYSQSFPALRTHSRPLPLARTVMQWAQQAGLEVAIATNPLFPHTAVSQRLEWAGVGEAEFSYRLVTSYECAHFAKPTAEYWAEVLAVLGRRPAEVMVIGNDYALDIAPAMQLGATAYWVAPPGQLLPQGGLAPAGQGSLADFFVWVREAGRLDAVVPEKLDPPALLPCLRATPAALQAALCVLPEAQWSERGDPQEWSPLEILCHLRDTEIEVVLPQQAQVLAEQNPFIVRGDTNQWVVDRAYNASDPVETMLVYMAARQAMVARLQALPATEWQRPARHTVFGPTRLCELAAIAVEHDRAHVAQARATVNAILARHGGVSELADERDLGSRG